MYYAYIKKKNSELGSLGVSYNVIARPVDNQGLLTSQYVQKVVEAQNPLTVVGDKLYEITSDTTCVLKKTLTAPDYYGAAEIIDNYPAEGNTYKQYYHEYEELDDTVVARVISEDPFTFTTLTHSQALSEAKILEDNESFTITKTIDEIKWERINRLKELRTVMAKKASLTSELIKIAESNSGYDPANISVDTFVDQILVDPYNSGGFDIENINDEYVLVAQDGEESFTFKSVSLPLTITHCFVMGYCISGDYTVRISNDGGSHWETATFDEVSKSKVSNEITFSESPTGSVILEITMERGDLQYNPILSGWGILWKNA